MLSESDQWLPAALSFKPVAGLALQIAMKSAASSAQWTSATSGAYGRGDWIVETPPFDVIQSIRGHDTPPGWSGDERLLRTAEVSR